MYQEKSGNPALKQPERSLEWEGGGLREARLGKRTTPIR
jgi:hypothetical protein